MVNRTMSNGYKSMLYIPEVVAELADYHERSNVVPVSKTSSKILFVK